MIQQSERKPSGFTLTIGGVTFTDRDLTEKTNFHMMADGVVILKTGEDEPSKYDLYTHGGVAYCITYFP